MSWRFRKDGFQNVKELIDKPDCSLEMLSKCPTVKAAFKRQFKDLLDFLIINIRDVIDIALGDKEAPDQVITLCLFFLTNQSPSFTAQFSNNPIFLSRLSKAFNQDNITQKKLISIARILEFLVKVSNGFVLKTFPDKKDLLPKLLKHIKIFPVYSLLCEITDHGHKVTLEYLESINASKIIYEAIGTDTFLNGRLLTLLTNIISAGMPGSPLVTYLVDEAHLDTIFNLALSDNPTVSSQSFKLLLAIYGLCDEDPDDSFDEDNDTNHIFSYIVGKMPEMCTFINSPKPFCEAKFVCNDLLVTVIATCIKIPDTVYSLLFSLFPKIFEQPTRSFLHCLFLKLLKVILDRDEELFERFDIRPQIVSHFRNKDNILAAYWGHLYTMTSYIIESKTRFPKECDGWDEFLANTYEEMKSIISKQYGGPIPKEKLPDLSSDDEFKPPSKFYLMSEGKNIQFITQDEIDADFDDRLALRSRRK